MPVRHIDLRLLARVASLVCSSLMPLTVTAVEPPRDGSQLRFDGIYREDMESYAAQAFEHLRFARDGTVEMVRVYHRLDGLRCIDDSARGTYRATAKKLTITWMFGDGHDPPRAKKLRQSGFFTKQGSVVLRRWWGHGEQWLEITHSFQIADLPKLTRCPS